MQKIINRTTFTPGLAVYCEAVKTGSVMTVNYFTSAKTPIAFNVHTQARIMEASTYEKMIKAPAEPKGNKKADNPNCKTIDGGKQTDLKYGKELSAGEKDALDLAQDSIDDSEEDVEQIKPVFTKGMKRAAEPKPKQRLAENMRQAETDDVYTVAQIQKAMQSVEVFDDKGARDEFIGALGQPIGNKKDLQEYSVRENTLDESVSIMNRFLNS